MKNIAETYFKIPITIRYTLITLINSLVAYLFYVSLFFGMYFKNSYYMAVFINFIVPASFSYCMFRFFVFNTRVAPLPEYIKTIIVLAGAFFVNLFLMAFLSGLLGIDRTFTAVISLGVVFVLTYIALKHYAFNYFVDYLYRPIYKQNTHKQKTKKTYTFKPRRY
ncbi:MAG: GtrA family protein [Alphaproteobacteria bacterium]|jgi:putative flippase GtrA|nr:GtrA family protein [Alphaproteobacteria bacterium]